MYRKLLVVAVTVFVSLGSQAQTRSADASKEYPFQPGGTLEVEAEFQDVEVTVKPESDKIRIVIHMEATDWAAKEQLMRYLPDFVQIGKNYFVFVNDVKHRPDLSQLAEKKEMPAYVLSFGTTGKPLGRVQIEVPPGMNITIVTATGRCFLNGDLGEGKARFNTYSGLIRIRGAADFIETQTALADVKLNLSRRCRSLSVAIERGSVEIEGVADAMDVVSKAAPVTIRASIEQLFTGVLEAPGGRITSDCPGERSSDGKRFTLQGPADAPKLTVHVEKANIAVRKL